MASSVEEAQDLENKSLAARHAREWDDEKARQRLAANNGTFDPGESQERNGAIMTAQQAEKAAQAQKQAHQLAERDLHDCSTGQRSPRSRAP